jgi:hypothetical protein
MLTEKENAEIRALEVSNLAAARNELERIAVTGSSRTPVFRLNDMVMLLAGSLRKENIKDKKTPRYSGPYKILQVDPHNIYQLESETGRRKTAHVSRMIRLVPRVHEGVHLLEGEC